MRKNSWLFFSVNCHPFTTSNNYRRIDPIS